MELSSSSIKKFLIFSQKKTFLYIGKRNFLIFQAQAFKKSYISGGTSKDPKTNKKSALKKFLSLVNFLYALQQ